MSQTKAQLVEGKGDAVFDTDTLVVDSTNNRVGVGTSSPSFGAITGVGLEIEDTSAIPGLRINGGASGGFLEIYVTNEDAVIDNRDAGGDLVFKQQSSETARIDSSGRLLVGTSSSTPIGSADSRLQVIGSDFSKSSISLVRHQTGVNSPSLLFGKSRGSAASPTIVDDGDEIGKFRFHAYDGDNFDSIAAKIAVEIDGTPGADDMPGRLVFSTTADGSSSPTERMRITSNGTVQLYNSPGIDFSGIQTNAAGMSSETLDSYEEGTWTPTLDLTYGTTVDTSGFVGSGRYVKIGRMVYVEFSIDFNDSSVNATTDARFILSGLPFNAANTDLITGAGTGWQYAQVSSGNNAFYHAGVSGTGSDSWYLYTTHLDGTVDFADEIRGYFMYEA